MNFAAYLNSFVAQKPKKDTSYTKTDQAISKWRKSYLDDINDRYKAAFDGQQKTSKEILLSLGIKSLRSVNTTLRRLERDNLVRKLGKQRNTNSISGFRYLWEWIE